MGDFLLDLRPAARRDVASAAERMRFAPHLHAFSWETELFGLGLTCSWDPGIWGPFVAADQSLRVALAGRVALPAAERSRFRGVPGEGGEVCRALAGLYAREGIRGLERLSGNFTVLLFDRAARRLDLLTDCTGVFPAFVCSTGRGEVYGSHPDVVAAVAGEADALDEASLAEFALTGTVSPPYTYYRSVRSLGRAAHVALVWSPDGGVRAEERVYAPLVYRGPAGASEEDLADELAAALRQSVALRSDASHGRCAVALSGGLDSRTVLAAVSAPANTLAFTCYDADNVELRTARAIARAAGVEFLPLPRPFEYYGDTAELGSRVGGGMGSFANNHFLGVLPRLHAEGMRTLLTGCYCDYLFKGLPLNRRTDPLTGREELAPFNRQFYFAHHWPETDLAREASARIEARFPAELACDVSDAGVFEIEQRRTFPLAYEGDNAQRLVPQRLTGWFLPISDPAVMDVYTRIPYRWKLNRSIFSKTVQRICGDTFSGIADANTGMRVGAAPALEAVGALVRRAVAQWRRLRPSIATQGSWPDWHHYVHHSPRLEALWRRPNERADALFRRLLGRDRLPSGLQGFQDREVWLALKLLTLKLWLEQRG